MSAKLSKTARKSGRAPVVKDKGGRPFFVPTEEQRRVVAAASGFGLQHVKIVKLVINPDSRAPIDTHTLRKHFREELDRGQAQTHFNVGKSLYDQAVGIPRLDEQSKQVGWVIEPVPSAGIWFTKAQMGWKENIVNEHEFPDGLPAQEVVHDISDPSKASIADLAAAYREIAAGGKPFGPAGATGGSPPAHSARGKARRRSGRTKDRKGASSK